MSDEQIVVARCPACRARISCPPVIMPGDFLYCQECHRRFEVVSQNPLVLDWAAEELNTSYIDRY